MRLSLCTGDSEGHSLSMADCTVVFQKIQQSGVLQVGRGGEHAQQRRGSAGDLMNTYPRERQ